MFVQVPRQKFKNEMPPTPLRILAQKLFLIGLGGRDNKKDPDVIYYNSIYLKLPIKDPTTASGAK